eukprot:152591_1
MWSSLKALHIEGCSRPIKINDNEFVVATPNFWSPTETHGLYKYNINNNKWLLFLKYPNNIINNNKWFNIYENPLICHDKISNILYIYSYDGNLMIINTKTKSVQLISTLPRNSCCSFVINKKFNLIHNYLQSDSRGKDMHIHWNDISDKNDKYTLIDTFEFNKIGTINAAIINVRSQNLLLLFGGWNNARNKIRNKYNRIRYCLYDKDSFTQKWTEYSDIKFPRVIKFGYDITSDDKYVIICGGQHMKYLKGYKKIFVFDINNKKIVKSSINCPISINCTMSSPFHAIIMGNNKKQNAKLVFGFVRYYKLITLNFPKEILELIL